MSVLQLGAAVAVGGGVGAAIIALQNPILSRWRQDNSWLRERLYQFSPEPAKTEQWVALIYIGIFLSFFVLLFLTLNVFIALALMIAVMFIPRMLLDRAWNTRKKKIDEQLPVAVAQMANGVGSGMTLVQSIERLAERAPEPIRTEFRVISNQWKHGSDLTQAIDEARRRLDLPNFNLFSSALSINAQMGGNVVTTLDRLAQSLEGIQEMQHEVLTATAEGRMSIKFLMAAPLVFLVLLCFINFTGVVLLFTEPLGRVLLGLALLLDAIGVAWAWKIVNADI
ncbi:MAG: type II secretion system F family protein [Planctomycetota bacterium]